MTAALFVVATPVMADEYIEVVAIDATIELSDAQQQVTIDTALAALATLTETPLSIPSGTSVSEINALVLDSFLEIFDELNELADLGVIAHLGVNRFNENHVLANIILSVDGAEDPFHILWSQRIDITRADTVTVVDLDMLLVEMEGQFTPFYALLPHGWDHSINILEETRTFAGVGGVSGGWEGASGTWFSTSTFRFPLAYNNQHVVVNALFNSIDTTPFRLECDNEWQAFTTNACGFVLGISYDDERVTLPEYIMVQPALWHNWSTNAIENSIEFTMTYWLALYGDAPDLTEVPASSEVTEVQAVIDFLAKNTADNRMSINIVENATNEQILAAITEQVQALAGDDAEVEITTTDDTRFRSNRVENVTVTITVNPTTVLENQTIYFSRALILPQAGATAVATLSVGIGLLASAVVAVKIKKV